MASRALLVALSATLLAAAAAGAPAGGSGPAAGATAPFARKLLSGFKELGYAAPAALYQASSAGRVAAAARQLVCALGRPRGIVMVSCHKEPAPSKPPTRNPA